MEKELLEMIAQLNALMDSRYKLMQEHLCKNLSDLNISGKNKGSQIPTVKLIISNFDNAMQKETENVRNHINRIKLLGRAPNCETEIIEMANVS